MQSDKVQNLVEIDFILSLTSQIRHQGRKVMSHFMKKALATVSVLAAATGATLADDFTIGLTNGWVGSEWRTQMIEEAQAAAAAWGERGVDVEVVVQSSNVDVPGQIAHVRNFISQGVDAIIINPNSPTAFDPVFAQAASAGILVISTDAEVSSQDAIYVGIDQKGWAEASARWLAETLGGEGTVVAINGVAGHPANIVMLTADAFGVLPPIARLTPEQAMYHFLSGYTALVGSTEMGSGGGIKSTFSTCFGAPFMPRHPSVYGNLLKERIAKGHVQCWLLNTGWSGGKATDPGIKRMPIKATRALLTAALDGSLNNVEFRRDPNFGFEVPVSVPGVEDKLLDPRQTWADAAAYDAQAEKLKGMFRENFKKYEDKVDQDVRDAAI